MISGLLVSANLAAIHLHTLGRAVPAAPVLLDAAAKKPPWAFDLVSAIIGFALGILLAVAIWVMRDRIAAGQTAISTRATGLREQLAKGARDRYAEAVIQSARRGHLLRRYADLSEIYVPHLFVIPHANPLSERLHDAGARDDRWRQFCLHDLLHRAQTTIDLRGALQHGERLAVLGPMGSGRTTLLAYMAQTYAAGEGWRLLFEPLRETDSLELRAARDRERARVPAWIALDSVNLSLAQQEEGSHPLLEPISDYLGSTLRRIIARPSVSLVRSQIIEGKCILLCDNLDALDAAAQQEALEWLNKLSRAYPGNMIVLAGAAEGYGRLWDLGFAPVLLDGWRQAQVSQFVERWAALRDQVELAAWRRKVEAARAEYEQQAARDRREGRPPESEFAPPPAPERPAGLLRVWREGNRERVMPLDLALAGLLWREQDDVPAAALMRHAQTVLIALDRIEDSPLSPPQWARILSQAAWQMQCENRQHARRDDFEQPISEVLAPVIDVEAGETADGRKEDDHQTKMERMAREALDGLIRMGDLLMDVGRGRVAFVHPSFGMYLAAQYAARNGLAEEIRSHVNDPRWQGVVLFYSALAPVVPLIRERLKGADDIFRSGFFAAAGYLAACPQPDPRLRGGILAELAQIFLDARLPAMLRQRAVAALADSRDKGTLYLFGQALRHADPNVRRLGVWGLARLGDDKLIDGLLHTLSDADLLVRIDVLYALGSLGGEAVIDGLVRGLQDEDELVRRVGAEMLAAVGGEGWDLLRQAAESDDMYIRRAAIHGLSMVNETWAAAIVEQTATEDGEWYVRSAAVEALERARNPLTPVLSEPPRVTDQGWLVAWAEGQGVDVSTRPAALEAIAHAIRAKEWTTQLAAADALRVCGGVESIPALLDTLQDDDVLVREAVYTALHEIHLRTGTFVARPGAE